MTETTGTSTDASATAPTAGAAAVNANQDLSLAERLEADFGAGGEEHATTSLPRALGATIVPANITLGLAAHRGPSLPSLGVLHLVELALD